MAVSYPETEGKNDQRKFVFLSLMFIVVGIPTMLITLKLINDLEIGLKYEAIKTY